MHSDSPENTAGIPSTTSPLKITLKLGTMPSLRSSSRLVLSRSGSARSESNNNDRDAPADDDDNIPTTTTTRRGRRVAAKSYVESDPDEEPFVGRGGDASHMFDADDDVVPARNTRSRRHEDYDDDDDSSQPRRSSRRRIVKREDRDLADFVVSDEGGTSRRYNTRHSQSKPKSKPDPRELRAQRANKRANKKDADYTQRSSPSGDSSFTGHESLASGDVPMSGNEDGMGPVDIEEQEEEEEEEAKGYGLRKRVPVNYAIPPALEEMQKPPPKPNNRGNTANRFRRKKGPGWSAGGAELGRWMGLPGDDSDSDAAMRTPKKPIGLGAFDGGVAAGGSGLLPPDFAASGTPSNLGKVTDATLADADPLGVNVNVTFDEVGGLDDHIHSLKEMTLLPLLYPEVFQQFNVTPPRGVLFHGPPGTGKTLLARALAASCRSNGKQISFFMRKGADALSKWVGEAERQLRLLFEEARNAQPSIIFFDEIDGLAPVRSSKQDQIHASIVSTLLALMDGMDGRGQVVVIGATNRPDAIDPALRRPGRFDREFYFPLPKLEAREKILGIMTKSWQGWAGDEGENKCKGLAKMTKGYGGADLRALCTEAALNAVQRRYPQIYKSNDRLLLQPDSISVGLRDFMISIKKLVPSSARSSASVATPLPPQFESLLFDAFAKSKAVLERVLPTEKKLTALEEAEFEDEDDEAVALDRELLMQSMDILRVHRPRILLYGAPGMGQTYIGAAMLHHLEGYHVQSLELGTLLGDSTRTVEAAIVQLFVEAKRHQPSIIYMPSLIGWCATVSETARSTVKAMLDTLAPTDPILLLAIIDGQFKDLPHDVRAWFGFSKDNRVELSRPTDELREKFFEGLMKDIKRPPNQFTDGVKRRKRILEVLPIAPPLEPRKPSPAELEAQARSDQRIITILKYRLGPILTELKRKFKRFTKRATEEYTFDMPAQPAVVHAIQITEVQMEQDGPVDVVTQEHMTTPATDGHTNGDVPAPPVHQEEPLYNMDLERMHTYLYKDRYLTPDQFLADVRKILHNTEVRHLEDHERMLRAQAMFTAAEVSIQEFDHTFRMECERMAVREKNRREERKKEEGDKGNTDKGDHNEEVITRRSARHNGQAPELMLTDPVKLERRLKRQRSDGQVTEWTGSDSDSRDAKRSKMLGEVDGEADAEGDLDLDPLDTLHPTVHFADQMHPHMQQQQQQQHGYNVPSMFNQPYNGHMDMNGHLPARTNPSDLVSLLNPVPPHASPVYEAQSQPMYSPNPYPNGNHYPYAQDNAYASGSSHQHDVYDTDPMYGGGGNIRTAGNYNRYPVDSWQGSQPPHEAPSLLEYPLLQEDIRQPQPIHTAARPTVHRPPVMNGFPSQAPATDDPFVDVPPPLSRQVSAMIVDVPMPSSKEMSKSKSPQREPTPLPPRTPTPLPDFHVDEGLLSQLQGSLRGNTSGLNVEQLEQLRATCLAAVWRRRSDWDRDTLVRELQDTVSDFVDDIGVDDGDESDMH